MIRPSLGFFGALLVLSGCATAVMPDGTADDVANGGDSGATTDPSGYGDGSDAGKDYGGSTGGSDGGTSSSKDGGGSKVDSGSPSTSGPCSASGVLATFDFNGEPGDQSATAVKTSATGITAGEVKRASGLTGVSGSDSMNSSGWSTSSSVDTSKYYTFTITPDSACTLDVTSIAIDTQKSGTGPAKGSVATSKDSFGLKTAFTPGSASNVTTSISGATGALEIRVYGYNASSGSGTFRVQNSLTVSGSLH